MHDLLPLAVDGLELGSSDPLAVPRLMRTEYFYPIIAYIIAFRHYHLGARPAPIDLQTHLGYTGDPLLN